MKHDCLEPTKISAKCHGRGSIPHVNQYPVMINKDTVRRVLGKHYRPDPGRGGPSWLSFLGHSKDSLWSVDLFCCESLSLNTHWTMVVMDQCDWRCFLYASLYKAVSFLQRQTCGVRTWQ